MLENLFRAKVIVSESIGSKSGNGVREGVGGAGRPFEGKKPLMSSFLRSVGVWASGKEGDLGGSLPKASFLAVQMSLGLALARKESHNFFFASWIEWK